MTSRLPCAEELVDRALYYILHHVGDAVYVDEPAWVGDAWELPLRVKGMDGTFGRLVLTPQGEVIEARSTSRLEVRAAIRAARGGDAPSR